MPNVIPINKKPRAPRIEDWAIIFSLIAENASLKVICEEMNLHAPTVITRISESNELTRDYNIALGLRAEVMAEKVIALADSVVDGDTEASVLKAVAPIYQWAAAQMDPQKWAKATKTEITGANGKDLQLGNNVIVFQLPDNSR